jgi:hypothetical protein
VQILPKSGLCQVENSDLHVLDCHLKTDNPKHASQVDRVPKAFDLALFGE